MEFDSAAIFAKTPCKTDSFSKVFYGVEALFRHFENCSFNLILIYYLFMGILKSINLED